MLKRLFSSRHPLLPFLILIGVMAWIQFSVPDLPDNDGFYHIKLAWLMRTEGLKPDFEWLPLTILNEREYYDHHFLFHVALIPFTFGDLVLGAKWAAVVFASLAFMTVWLLLYRQQVPLAGLWTLGLLGISGAFLYRMSIPRAQSLSLAFLVLGLNWILSGRYRRLGVLAFIYVWTYDAFPLLLVMALLHLLAAALTGRRIEPRPILWIGMGIAMGLILNPYFPDNLVFTYRHLLPKLADATSIRVGNEWYPYDTGQLLANSFPALAAFASGALALGLTGRKMELRTAVSFLAALFFGWMLFQARRFVEYFPPFALIFAAFAWAPLLARLTSDRAVVTASSRPQPNLNLQAYSPFLVAALLVLACGLHSMRVAQDRMRASKPRDLYQKASIWLEHNTAEGERIFQTDWDDFPRLFFYNTHNTYLVGLDPTYFQLADADLYNQWVQITRGDIHQPSRVIAERFAADYVLSDLHHGDFIRRAAGDPGMVQVYRDDQAVVYHVVTP